MLGSRWKKTSPSMVPNEKEIMLLSSDEFLFRFEPPARKSTRKTGIEGNDTIATAYFTLS